MALRGDCPRCGKGHIFKSKFGLEIVPECTDCHLPLADNDSGDGPAVFLIFILGFSIVPLAVLFDLWFAWPLWVHAIVWSIIGLGMTIGMLRPAKAYILILQYRHTPDIWEEKGKKK